METRRLGRTDHHSTVAILGGAAFSQATPEQAERGWSLALEAGVNHLDIAPRYGDAEVLVGPLLPPVRHRVFVAAKTTRRNADGVRAQLEETLARLRTDHLDLYQLHAVTDIAELDTRGDAVDVLMRVKEEGLARFVGITGHNLTVPEAFLEALRRYDLDTVMFPVNARLWADSDYRNAAERLLDVCAQRDLGVMAIKAAARRPWGDGERFATTWYEPHADAAAVEAGVRFVLSTPGVHAFCTPGDLDVLALALDAAARLTPMTADERARAMTDALDLEHIFPIPV